MDAQNTSQTSPEDGDDCARCGKCRCGGTRHSKTPAGHGTITAKRETHQAEGATPVLSPAAV